MRRSRSSVLLIALVFAAPAVQAESPCKLARYAELPVTMIGTRPTIAGTINGAEAHFLVDSGAFFNVISRDSAQKYGLKIGSAPPEFSLVSGVGGWTLAGLATVEDFTLAGFGTSVMHKAQFLVVGNSTSGPRIDGMIGQNMLNLLGRADTEYDLASGVIRLFRSEDCGHRSLAYWAEGMPVAEMDIYKITAAEPHLRGTARINDKKIDVVFDTGASRSTLDTRAAARAGIEPDQSGVKAAGMSHGFGHRAEETWIAHFDLLDLGGEQIKNARLFVTDLPNGMDMLLGADFFLSHRIYVAPKQRKIYFTYNGGRVFDLGSQDNSKDADAAAPANEPSSTVATADEPKDAEAFKRRGAASAGRREFADAIADFDRAIQLDSTDPDAFYQRGLAKLQNGQPALAMADFDAALKLKADHTFALVGRGTLRLANKDEAGARADFDAAIASAPNDSSLSLSVAETYANARHFDAAIGRLDKWIAAHPKDDRLATALNERCWSRAMLGKELDLALADCNAAVKSSRSSEDLDSRAMVELQLGRLDQSIADYRAALNLQPKGAGSLYGLGVAETKKGMTTEGKQDMQAAIAISPQAGKEFKRLGLTP